MFALEEALGQVAESPILVLSPAQTPPPPTSQALKVPSVCFGNWGGSTSLHGGVGVSGFLGAVLTVGSRLPSALEPWGRCHKWP